MKGALFLDLIRSLPHHPEHNLALVIRPSILKVLIDAAARAPWLKIIITSRTEVDIQHSPILSPSRRIYDMTWPDFPWDP